MGGTYSVFDDVLKKNVTFMYDGNDEPSDDYIDKFVLPEARQMAPPEKPGFMGAVGDALSKRGENIASRWNAPSSESPLGSIGNAEDRIFGTAGQIAGGINDVLGAGIKSAYRAVVPEDVRGFLGERTNAVVNGLDAPPIRQGATSLADFYASLKAKYPQVADRAESTLNVAGLAPTGIIGKRVGGAALDATATAGKAVGTAAKDARGGLATLAESISPMKNPEIIDKMIDVAIDKGINKGIRPSVAGKGNFGQVQDYLGRARDAVKQIAANKNNLVLSGGEDGATVAGKLPTSLTQFSEAIDQTKKGIFQKYDAMAKQAGADGAMVDLKPVSDELLKVADGVVLQDLDPNIAKYASDRAKMFTKREAYTAEQAQDAITILNKSLESFYKNPSYENASKAGIDAIIANNLRRSLDKTIESTAGPGYQELKNAYGSLKTIERDVAHRAIVDARKNVKGLVDFTDIYTSGELMAGLATMSPAMIVKGATWKGVQQYIKMMNNPNRIVKSMFGEVDGLMDMKNRVAAGAANRTRP